MNLLPLFIIILAIAFLTSSDSLFYLAYVLGGIGLLTFVWMRQALSGVRSRRRFSARAFHGEEVAVELDVTNQGRWPLLWLRVHESIPLSLHVPNFEHRIVSLAPGEKTTLHYQLNCQRRGYYHLGPLWLETGDLLQLTANRQAVFDAEPFIVYPRVVPLRQLGLPSQLPFGNLPSRQRIFEDPSRFFGVRDYVPGDSLRRINWKSSARLRRLQVKRFQPAIALHTVILLDLNDEAYSLRGRAVGGEMGIVVAASIAAHLIERRQQVGLALLGRDQVTQYTGLQVISPAHGREHLMRILEALARAEMAPTAPLASVLPQVNAGLGWGSTAVVISPGESPHLVDSLLQMRRQGFHIMFIASDSQTPFRSLQGKLDQIGIPAYWVTREREMDVWR